MSNHRGYGENDTGSAAGPAVKTARMPAGQDAWVRAGEAETVARIVFACGLAIGAIIGGIAVAVLA